ncbi:MAG: site-specific integrase, partial [Gallionella sp.]
MNNTELLDEFFDALWLEDGLSRNTLDSYRRDLTKFADWLQACCGMDLLDTAHADIQVYLAYLIQQQHAKSSSTSRTLSSLKRLFRYLLRERKISVDPTLQIDT